MRFARNLGSLYTTHAPAALKATWHVVRTLASTAPLAHGNKSVKKVGAEKSGADSQAPCRETPSRRVGRKLKCLPPCRAGAPWSSPWGSMARSAGSVPNPGDASALQRSRHTPQAEFQHPAPRADPRSGSECHDNHRKPMNM